MKFIHKMQNETKRQIAHYLIGNLAILIFLFFKRTTTLALFILALAVGYVIALRIKEKGSFTLLQAVIKHVERPHEKKSFPAQPAFLFLIGAVITIALFSNQLLALAGLIVVTYGDTTATLIGKYKGKIELVTNRTLEGSIAGIIAAAIVLLFLFPPEIAWAIAGIGMLAEYLPFNDNIGIPIVSAITASLLI